MSKLILGIAGEMGSGKGTVATHFVNEKGGSAHRFSTILRDILDRVYLDQSRENFQVLSMILRKNFGEDIMAKSMYHDVKNDNHDIVVVDGVRRMADIAYLREIPHFKLVYIDADIRTRYERIVKRGEKTDDFSKTFEEFKLEHDADSELQIRDLKNYADYVLNNDGTFVDLYKQLDQIITENIGQ
ncbi:MAG: AAA family ATPase [Candidatus Moranbacteria bacterium]|nr:AAA family ATPase [Candidatus Moranbacteria bacterium]